MAGRPIQVIERNEAGRYVLNEDALAPLLECYRLEGKKLLVLAISGAFRKGKSFVLNVILRYLRCQQKDASEDDRLFLDPRASLDGFDFRQSEQRVTEGIIMWSEPFFVKNAKGEEVAVLILDTEGAFDTNSSQRQCATVFALATLLSSLLIFNVQGDVQEDKLQCLDFFAEYAALTGKHSEEPPFQKLLFLVRDWSNTSTWGAMVGERILDLKMATPPGMDTGMVELRERIVQCFEERSCFLLPHPGDKVDLGSIEDVRIGDLTKRFQDNMEAFVQDVFTPSRIPIKKVGGNEITAREWVELVKTVTEHFKDDTLPEPATLYRATAQKAISMALANAAQVYEDQMAKVVMGTSPLSASNFRMAHQIARGAALIVLGRFRIMGGTVREKLTGLLDETLDMVRPRYHAFNERHRIHQDQQARQALLKANQEQRVSRWQTFLTVIAAGVVVLLML